MRRLLLLTANLFDLITKRRRRKPLTLAEMVALHDND